MPATPRESVTWGTLRRAWAAAG